MTATSQFTATHVKILDGDGRPGPMGPIAGLALGTMLSETLTRVDDLEAGVVVGDISSAVSGAASLTLADNEAAAWTIKEGTTAYLVFVTTNGSERLKASQRITTTDGVASGTERVVGGIAAVNPAASTAITGTTETQANFDTATYSIPANTLKVGTIVRVRAMGRYTATTGAETHVFGIALGATNLCVTGNLDPADNNVFDLEFEFVVRATGAAGTVVGAGVARTGAQAVAAPVTHLLATGSGATSTTGSLDMTGALTLGMFVDRQGTATDGDSMRVDYFRVEIIG